MKLVHRALLFAWGFYSINDLSLLLQKHSLERLLWKGTNLNELFWILMVCLLILEAMAFVYLMRPSTLGYRVAQIAILVGLSKAVIIGGIGLSNPELFKQSYITSRLESGLSIRPLTLQGIEDPVVRAFPFAFDAGSWGLLLMATYLFEKKRLRVSGHTLPPPLPRYSS